MASLALLLALGPAARSQDAATDALVQRVVANVQRYHAALPSITADESIQSKLSQHGLYMAHGRAEATLRVSAGKPGEQLNETRTYLTVDGKKIEPGKKGTIPFEMNGAFSRISDTYFFPAKVGCYLFTRLPEATDGSLQLRFAVNTEFAAGCSDHVSRMTGLVRIDPGTAQIRHIERTITVPAPEDKHTVTFLSVDYLPAKIGAESFWLPTLIVAELDGKKGRFEAMYSNYHRYTASVTIVSGDGSQSDAPSPQP